MTRQTLIARALSFAAILAIILYVGWALADALAA